MIRLACLVRAHRRADTLRVVLSELERYKTFPGIANLQIFLLVDRPSKEVQDFLAERTWRGWMNSPPDPVLSDRGEHFCEAQNFHLEWMEGVWDLRCGGQPDWVYVVDDDFWFEPHRITTALVSALSDPDIDAYYCPCLFIQDAPDTYNPDRQHESIRLYRHVPRARFSGKRMLSVPDGPHDTAIISGRTARFPVPILEYGGYTASDRAAVIDAYKRARKDDDFTRALLSPRRLHFPTDWDPHYGSWTSLYPCHA